MVRNDDLARLRAVHELVGDRYDELVDRFYGQLEAEPSSASSLPPPDRRAGLKRAMGRQFRELLTAERDEAYAASRVHLAEQHVRTGVPVSIYVRSFGVFEESLAGLLAEDGHALGPADQRALTRAVLVDIGQVLDAGDAARRRAEAEAEEAGRRVQALRAKEHAARVETLQRLAAAAEFRDTDTGNHVARMSEYAALLARLRRRRES